MATLLMIHGIGCDGSAWDVMKPGFEAAGWTCEAITLFPDRRVRENPPASLPDLGFADFVEAATAEARRLAARDGAKPAVIGHSMGGLIAQVLAERGEVSKAVFLTPAQPKGCAEIGLPVAWTFLNIILRQDRKRSYKVWKTGFSWGVLNRVPKARHDAIYATALYDSGKVYGDMTDGIEVDERKVTIPTLTIAGCQDRATLPKGVRKVAAKYAKSPAKGDFIEYPDHAHWIVDEPGTDKVVADIAGWLGRAA
ncbi:MAG: alpha/beta hydrolase [Hyphomonas sp.]|uniref:alpha/beta hydrolase n=1 Tax=Hyphomonas sp. TaxID=87 RepID=UPI001790D422|nr:alpha/beta hydrolase [Hyphomonas sp.]MBU3919610.1 alpha/beta hydrolase [Alphaproteobacteria bacterium]MBA3068717.1 alpha/beta hydrolase [Hyphomonas sp.]MBU4063619.1 alpha/beta hydrolase [Alphaproteobacteria bacterium]MBU4165756.1 alpha/beta hydrolase [Alphaproteobacteria bacterium]MBU4569424.1 alpha/beta hydrolase [Alphaproteobacteria bacterium]